MGLLFAFLKNIGSVSVPVYRSIILDLKLLRIIENYSLVPIRRTVIYYLENYGLHFCTYVQKAYFHSREVSAQPLHPSQLHR